MLVKGFLFLILAFGTAGQVSANCAVPYDLPANTWKQIGLPCTPPAGASTAGQILGDDLGGRASYNVVWALYSYDPASNSYTDVGYDGQMSPGTGYWIINTNSNSRSLTMPSGSQRVAPVRSDECPAAGSECTEVPLNYSSERAGAEQFNMISVPNPEQFLWGNVSVADNLSCSAANNPNGETAGGCSLDRANENNIFQSSAWKVSGNGYDSVVATTPLSAWDGLWVKILSSAQPDSQLRLQLPVDFSECPIFPADNPWNQNISSLPVHPNSAAYMRSIGLGGRAHADFGTVYNGAPNGIPITEVSAATPLRDIAFQYADESDPGPYPIPANPAIEGGNNGTGDRHIILLDRDDCTLYEMFYAWPPGGENNPYTDRWFAGSGAVFDLRSNELRPDSWTSADAAGLPIYPGLVKYEEAVIDKVIPHALRFTAVSTQRAYIHPATHFASSSTDPDLPPMGLRVRLKQEFDISGFSEEVQVILVALKKYGMLLADNGSDWFVSGAPDPRWNDDNLSEMHNVPGTAFEAVYTGELITQ